ncbi:hypothetical protein D049_1812B, partial [Vibrio parahaemolyticus VPTS-2010]
AAKPN